MKSATSSQKALGEIAKAYGCVDVVELSPSQPVPEQLEYLDLLPARGTNSKKVLVDGVAEHQGTALLYLLDARNDRDSDSIVAAQKVLANRSDPAWLGVIKQGSLEIYPIGFRADSLSAEKPRPSPNDQESSLDFGAPEPVPFQCIAQSEPHAPLFFQSLVQETFGEGKSATGTDHVYRLIYDLLLRTTEEFVEKEILPPLEVLSMTGRALFFRFLMDRKIVKEAELPEICPTASDLKDAFSNAEKAAATSAWLDETFNGDFLVLIDEGIPSDDREARQKAYLKFYKRVQRKAGAVFFTHLEAIQKGWRGTGADFQLELKFDWEDFNFAHIPVGVLSQVYESFSHKADPVLSKQNSVHYTPRLIAKLMVDECFGSAPDKASAKVLDPSCGAGIFLVLTFRRLVQERWERDGKRPDKKIIHEILYQQLRGFDVSESALRLAALSLYITAIEINGTQRPPKILKFPKNLRDSVLHRFGDEDENDTEGISFSLGSLGNEVPSHFNGFFDIVIGNPPWTRLRPESPQNALANDKEAKRLAGQKGKVIDAQFTAIGKRVLEQRGLPELAKDYKNPDKNPDLPFVWRAAEWAKEGGIIALAMHGRLFQRTHGNGLKAWQALLKGIEVNGLINGTDLRATSVWKGVKAPWCLIFAQNRKPQKNHRFYFSTPPQDKALNTVGRFRIDYESAKLVRADSLGRQPWILKTLSLGTWLDVEVVNQILGSFPISLGEFWKSWDPKEEQTGEGFNRSPKLIQKPAPFLGKLPVFEKDDRVYEIPLDRLETFKTLYGNSSANRPRAKELYQPPLVIIPQTPGEDPQTPQAYLADQAVAFSKSYYGYSCAGHPEAERLRSLIYLITHSTLFRYFVLMVSRSQGTDYMRFIKQDLDRIPFPDPAKLTKPQSKKLLKLTNSLQKDVSKPWKQIDKFIFKLYGLDDDDAQVIRDTLFTSAAYRKKGRPALEVTRPEDQTDFASVLWGLIQPFFEICGESAEVSVLPEFQTDRWREAWSFLSIGREGQTFSISPALLRKAMEQADRHGASRITVRVPGKKGLLIGVLNQRRWWTASRARLCAQHIISQHLEACGLEAPE